LNQRVQGVSVVHAELPRSDDVPRLPYRFGAVLRRAIRPVFGRYYDITLHDDHLVPATGPVILASNHLGVLDGPTLWCFAPRFVHALIKREMFTGKVARGLRAVGQIPIERNEVDPYAVRTALRVLRDGNALAIYPEGTRGAGDFARIKNGVAYLALATGAPVVPVACIGTRVAGISIGKPSPKGTRIDVVYGAPVFVPARPFPRRQSDVRALTADLHQTLRAHVQQAVVATGNPLPGAPDDEETE
jgi:1-acyl-sn-glycerol-3-phosphate acyltransferase